MVIAVIIFEILYQRLSIKTLEKLSNHLKPFPQRIKISIYEKLDGSMIEILRPLC